MHFTLDDHKQLLKSIVDVQAFLDDAGYTGQIFEQLLETFLDLTAGDCGFVGTVVQAETGSQALQLRAISPCSGNGSAINSMADWCAEGLRSPAALTPSVNARFCGEPILVKNPEDKVNSNGMQAKHKSLSCFMALPVQNMGKLVGLVGVARFKGSFSEDLAVFLQPLLKTSGRLFTGQEAPDRVADNRERKDIEHKLRGQQLLLEQILHQLPLGVFCKDINDDFRYTIYNGKCDELFCKAAENPLGKTDFEFLPHDRAQQYRKEDLEVIRTGKMYLDPGQRVDSVDGKTFYVRINKICVYDSNGKPGLIVGTAEDITMQRQFELELQLSRDEALLANKAKSEFLSRMSHELRTPLNAILGFGQLLQMSNQNLSDTQVEGVDQILAGGKHLLELIEDVLDLSRIETDHMNLSLERVSTAQVLQRCVSMVEALADSSGVQLFLPAGDIPDVVADPLRLQQVLVNLLTNAIKYNRVEGTVEIVITRQPGSKVRISVIDTGLGIRASDQALLFEPFERIGEPNIMIEGTGIGLSICKKLTELMGGEIGFESDFGEGSAFWMDLQEAVEADACEFSENETDVLRQAAQLEGLSVLYVEDHLASIRLMSEITQKIPKCEFAVATNAPDGVALAKSIRPDLIFMDINLPGLSGFDALEMLRNDNRTRKIPVIALSATATAATLERGKQAGFAHFLSKPLDLEQLFQAILSVDL